MIGLVVCSAALTPWPLPSTFTSGSTRLVVPSSFTFDCSSSAPCADVCSTEILRSAFTRYRALIVPSAEQLVTGKPALTSVNICVATSSSKLGPATNETYTLSISGTGKGEVHAGTVFGALHALETLSQLVDVNDAFAVSNAPITISDHPRFGFRGLMIDTARHFLPLEKLKQIVDGLHASKLNVLHWHIVDSQSFPCGSDRYPLLAAKGAYAPKAVYSPNDMRELVAYAKLRGVRVMPEWDIPGHGSWGKGMPSVMGCDIVLDPTQDATYTFLNAFLSEMMTIFEDEYVFLGGDEVQASCWDQNPAIVKWLHQKNMTSSELQQCVPRARTRRHWRTPRPLCVA